MQCPPYYRLNSRINLNWTLKGTLHLRYHIIKSSRVCCWRAGRVKACRHYMWQPTCTATQCSNAYPRYDERKVKDRNTCKEVRRGLCSNCNDNTFVCVCIIFCSLFRGAGYVERSPSSFPIQSSFFEKRLAGSSSGRGARCSPLSDWTSNNHRTWSYYYTAADNHTAPWPVY